MAVVLATLIALVVSSNQRAPQVRRPNPNALRFTERGTPRVDAIDDAVEAIMKASDVRDASIAIVKGTKLVYARGYTWGKQSEPITEPTTCFRQASVSKFVCALAAEQCIEDNLFTLDTKMQDILHLKTRDGKNPVDKRFGDITIRDLLQMDSGLPSSLPWSDVDIKNEFGVHLPVDYTEIGQYAAGHKLISKPGDKSQAFYNNSNYQFLGMCVAKARNRPLFISAIQQRLLEPLHITRIRDARELLSDQLSDEAHYYAKPPAQAPSVMSDPMPNVKLDYGDENLGNGEGAGGLSAAATDMARILACLNAAHPIIFKDPDTYTDMLKASAACDNNSAFSHKDSNGNSDAFGFYGLDSCSAINAHDGLYSGDKGGYLECSQNGIYFERGGLAYVVNWSGHTTAGESWYPVFESVMTAARSHDWGTVDHFPDYGMPSFLSIGVIRPITAVELQSIRKVHPIGFFKKPGG